jgi:hypothetical protein
MREATLATLKAVTATTHASTPASLQERKGALTTPRDNNKMNKLAVRVGIPAAVIVAVIAVILGIWHSGNVNASARCEGALAQIRSGQDKLDSWALQIRQDKLAYSKEWFPTSDETDQINSEVNDFNVALNALHSASANYNSACAGGQ